MPVGPVDLGQLVVEGSDSDDGLEPAAPSKSTSTLQLVKTHIRRHLSQDSLSKRKKCSIVGNSEQELVRRAELKRLMHKRIQDQLRSEVSQESSRSDTSSSHRNSEPLREPVLPGGGPRDNLEFSVTEDIDSGAGPNMMPSTPSDVDYLSRPESGFTTTNGNGPPSELGASCP